MPEATRVAGFRAWLKLGYCVRRGQKARISVWIPIPPSKKQIEAWKADGADPDRKPRTRYKLGSVWDRSQVDPLPPPAEPVPLDIPIVKADGDSLSWALPRLQAVVEELGCVLAFESLPDDVGDYFSAEPHRIAVNEANAVDHQVRTLVHELGHALLHLSDRDAPALTYAQEELVVESIAFTVAGALGLDTAGYSIPYLASWSDDDDALDVIEACAGLIDRNAKRIEDAIDGPDSAADAS
jgi:antirestriction protein ArdC